MGGGATFHTNLVEVEKASLSLSPEELEGLVKSYPALKGLSK